jgi:precorrin-2 dehydrogenase / sirohydrochlorin ferrochelatase
MRAALYPLFLNLEGRTCIVIGGNDMAEAKVRELLNANAVIRLIAPAVTQQILAWSREEKLCWESRSYSSGDLQDAFLVVSVADTETNAMAFEEAEAGHILCNAVDDAPPCNCYASAVVRRDPLQIAISTAGNSPALAQRLRKEMEERYGQEYASWVQRLGELRSRLFQDKAMDAERRRKILHEQASASAFEGFCRSITPETRCQS